MAFEGILVKADTKPSRWRRLTLSVSLVLHVGALVVGLVYSLWEVEEMPMPAIQVTLVGAPPPPPPPPPPAGSKKSSSKPRTKPVVKPTEIVQPKTTPKEEPKPEEPKDEGEANGQAGGEKGGVAGGVAGGVVGGVVGAPPPPPPPKDTGPKMVSAGVGVHQLAVNVNSPPYCCVKVPRALDRSGVNLSARVRVCVTADGQVNDVRLLEGANPAVDGQIPGFLRRWRYRPLVVDGRPTAFCYAFRYEMTVR